jgi:hypothetical protein
MKNKIKVGALVTIGALAVAMPAAAHPGGSSHGHGKGSSHKCQAHNRAYVESGTVDSTTASTLAQNSDGTWSGTLVVDVTASNHAARADQGQTVTYTFSSANLKVKLDNGTTGFTAAAPVQLIGKIAASAPKCTAPSSAPAPVFRMIVVGSSDSSGSSDGSDS